MSQNSTAENNTLNVQIANFCKHVAGSSQVTAIGLIDNYPIKDPNVKPTLQVLLIIRNFPPRILNYPKVFDSRNVVVFAVDEWIFERDIDRGFLGEALASKLIFPYSTLLGADYLREKEVALKKRLIIELLQNLVLSYPELAYRMQLKPQYFLYEVMLNRMRVFPLLAYELSNLLEGCKLKNEVEALKAYRQALTQLEAEQKINQSNGYVTISKNFVPQNQNPKTWLANLSKNAPRRLFTSLFGVFPQLLSVVSQNTEAFMKTQKINWRIQVDPNCYLIDSQKYVFVPTSEGLIPLSDRLNMESFVLKMFKTNDPASIKIEAVGGMLNDVFLIKANLNGAEKKVLVKRFKDWSGFKWFPLTLWSLGTRSFAVSGRARLGQECAASEFLRAAGFNVPTILHFSNAERLVFMEFIEGEDLSQSIKRISLAENYEDKSSEFAKVKAAGELMAKVHLHNMALGDSKPENMLAKPNGDIYLIDFEQSTLNGDKAWDIAEFLYYSGHYLQPRYSNGKAEAIAKAFISGYLKGGGNVGDIKKAGEHKYTRVFSVFTMPAIITSIANVCRKTEMKGLGETYGKGPD
jgi:tRNA A-37 threonylcarbamoyl transferase component Bud32